MYGWMYAAVLNLNLKNIAYYSILVGYTSKVVANISDFSQKSARVHSAPIHFKTLIMTHRSSDWTLGD